MGGVDLAGFESSPTKTEFGIWNKYGRRRHCTRRYRPNKEGLESHKERLANVFRETIVIASRRIKDLRDYVAGKEYAVGKLLARAGEEKVNDWTKTMHDAPFDSMLKRN